MVLNCVGLFWFMTPGAWEKTMVFVGEFFRKTDTLLLKRDGIYQGLVSWGKQPMEVM